MTLEHGLAAKPDDMLREHQALPKLVIGVFVSRLDMHYNRAPLPGEVAFVRHHPGRVPEGGAPQRGHDDRIVTLIQGRVREQPIPCYVVVKTIAQIDNHVASGEPVAKGTVFGMIRINSQVDVVVPWQDGLNVCVRPGDRVRAGETLLFEIPLVGS